MKRILFSLFILLLCSITFAQTTPEGVNYQAVARDATGIVLANQSLDVTITILDNQQNGVELYKEQHSTVMTNDFGLFNLAIGSGQALLGSFDASLFSSSKSSSALTNWT